MRNLACLVIAVTLLGCSGGGSDSGAGNDCGSDSSASICSSGLTARPVNNTCIAPNISSSGNAETELLQRFSNVSLSQPVKGRQAPGNSSEWFVAEKTGQLIRFSADDVLASREVYLTTRANVFSSELGFLGFAFSPDWPTRKEIYLSYNANNGNGNLSILSRIVVSDDSSLPATFSEEVLFSIPQPAQNHNGGDLAFGPDGYLYWGLGDGGGGNDRFDQSQNDQTLLGNMLRIDVNAVAFVNDNNPENYTIPTGNPFAANAKCGNSAGLAACAEIFAKGLRNPWRWSFDTANGDLYVADVGQSAREEIDRVVAGGNYGWPCREGFLDTNNSSSFADCNNDTFDEPIYDYPRSQGQSVTGGYVYRGSNVPAWTGKYLFADFVQGTIWALDTNTSEVEELIDTSMNISGFMQANDGELFVLSFSDGNIFQLSASNITSVDNAIPENIFDVGCIDQATSTGNAQMIPYRPNAEFWSDNAAKDRWLAIPNGTRIDGTDDVSDWEFPNGTVTMKNFVVDNKLIETRFFVRHDNGEWAGYTYEWNDNESNATLVVGGKDRTINLSNGESQIWRYLTSAECDQCHTAAAGHVLGISTPQLNGTLLYPSTGNISNQLETYNAIDLFTVDVSEPVSLLPALPDPDNTAETLDNRARAYLHTNCASCHRPGGGTPATIDLRFSLSLVDTGLCNADPLTGDLGITGAKIVTPGNTNLSLLHQRMIRRDTAAMPPLGSNIIDTAGAQLIENWINSLGNCP